ncbi:MULTISPECIES: NAD(P)/FAD-dependent oxidoreductase [unclassified Paenibacillus]|uniref:NAD(P)/FAD-dependent oxidoreductase n=1 Tax=unclassified Paenibacillus TaxID=185978 RepID=UPI001C10CA13|nr:MULTISPECIES: NAD(P)/FAD-dependent oxidoreductase [unclassified Paenibacillus]MBU5444721.1 NAD(P)/FAD-dependent oxidoreductase [Paenibacillus sp. MSJ-34]CAH0121097.1 Ferredoxin--NADP reductase [Paenibacillus sp. CECT 9249]
MNTDQIFDVTIVGGGPAGLFAAFYSGLREMKTKIIEFQPFLGGKVHVYPEKMIWDVGGLTPVTGAQFIEQIVAQGLTFDPEVVLGQKVTSLTKDESGHFIVHTSSGQRHCSKTVILAVGGGILKPTKLNIDGAERFEVTNLHYTVKSLARFKGKTILISGGGNAAIDWANELEPFAKKVYLTYRKDMLNGHEAQVTRLLNSTVECLFNTTIEKLVATPDHERIDKVLLNRSEDGEKIELAVDEVIINHGYERDKDLLENSELKIAMENEYCVAGTAMSETSVEGLYAAGDILHHDGKLHLIAGAFQDAANAVNKAKQFIAPEANAWGMVSTHNELFQQKNREIMKNLYTT